jgi:hypothetical protein
LEEENLERAWKGEEWEERSGVVTKRKTGVRGKKAEEGRGRQKKALGASYSCIQLINMTSLCIASDALLSWAL